MLFSDLVDLGDMPVSWNQDAIDNLLRLSMENTAQHSSPDLEKQSQPYTFYYRWCDAPALHRKKQRSKSMLFTLFQAPFPSHWNCGYDFVQILYLWRGRMKHKFQKETIYQESGELLFIAPKAFHLSEALTQDTYLISLRIPTEIFTYEHLAVKSLLSDCGEISSFLNCLNDSACSDFLHLPNDYGLWARDGFYTLAKLWAEGFGDNILLFQLASIFALLEECRNYSREPHSRNYQEILEYMQANCTTVTLSKLAVKFHYSPQYLSRYIHEHTGKKFSSLLRDFKMEKALLLLQNGETIEKVAEKVGYKSNRFYEVFKAHYGVTPHASLHNMQQKHHS